jgi:hypothetical protein
MSDFHARCTLNIQVLASHVSLCERRKDWDALEDLTNDSNRGLKSTGSASTETRLLLAPPLGVRPPKGMKRCS